MCSRFSVSCITRSCLLLRRPYSDASKLKNSVKVKTTKLMRLGELRTMKLDNDQFKEILTPEMKIIVELFKKNGFELRVAGGAVRDLLMGIAPHDIDFASTATPQQMKQIFTNEGIRMINASGEKHGTITARINDKENFEITTLRIDTATDGRHAEVEFTTDWQMDANRRDLTVNAMFLSIDGTVYDYFKGVDHLEQRKILFVGDAASRIQEDYLRILRYFRFYGRLAVDDNHHDASTLEAIKLNADGLARISGERLFGELVKILDGGFNCSLICLMNELQVLQYLGFPQNSNLEEFKDVCRKSLQLNPLAITKMAALLRTDDEVMRLHARLKLSNFDRFLLLFILRYRNEFRHLLESDRLRFCQTLLFKRDLNGTGSASDATRWVQELIKYNGHGDLLQKFNEWIPPKLPINGHDLQLRGIRKGPQLGLVHKELREIWMESDFRLSKEELLEKVPEILRSISSRRQDSLTGTS